MLTAEQQPPSPSYAGGTGSKASSGVRTFGTTDPSPDNASCKPQTVLWLPLEMSAMHVLQEKWEQRKGL